MLVSTARPKFSALHDLARQLVVWGLNSRQGFHCTNGNRIYEEGKRRFEDRPSRFEDRPSRFEGRPNRFEGRPSGFEGRPRRYEDSSRWSEVRSRRLDFRRSKWALEDLDLKKKEFNLETLVEHKKGFYTPHPDVLNRSQEEIKKFYSENEISTFGNLAKNCPPPVFNFKELDLPPEAMDMINKLKYTRPTPIQSVTWPLALSGYNMVGVAQTGSGKTLGFVLPGMIHMQNQSRESKTKGPIALIIGPTRELVQQTHNVLDPFAKIFGFKTAVVFGGASKTLQYGSLRVAEACVGTPGRIIDFLKESAFELSRCTYVVMDEADRLLDMGFEPQIRAIMSQMRPDAQILMWSATWPKEVKTLASDVLKNYVGVKFGSTELTANSNVVQKVIVCKSYEKMELLVQLLKEFADEGSKALVFCQTKRQVEIIHSALADEGIRAKFIHGDVSQNRRDHTMDEFRSGRTQCLIGTGVVSRGIDVRDIKHVINYDFPTSLEEYVHLIGRTGRSSNKGFSHTFFTSKDVNHARNLIKLLRESNQEVSEALLKLAERNGTSYSGF